MSQREATSAQSTPTAFLSPVAQDHDRDFPEVPANLWSDIRDNDPGFSAEFNEENIFMLQYMEAARSYYAEATNTEAQGRTLLKLFGRWADVVGQFVRWSLSSDPDNPLDATLSMDPEGAGEAMVRAFRTDSFTDSNGNSIVSYTQTPTSGQTGQFNVLPNEANSGTTLTATSNEQAWIIIGWYEPVAGNVVPYDYIQADINDNVGVRREEFLKYQMESKGTIKWSERSRGPLMVPPGFNLDVDVNIVTTGIEFGLWPVGVEVVRADATEFGGVLG